MSYDAWGVSWGTPSAWDVAWVQTTTPTAGGPGKRKILRIPLPDTRKEDEARLMLLLMETL